MEIAKIDCARWEASSRRLMIAYNCSMILICNENDLIGL